MNKKKFFIVLILFFIMLNPYYAKEKLDIEIDAESIEFNGTDQSIMASGNVNIAYKDIKIGSKKAYYSHLTKQLILNGNISLVRDKLKLKCNGLFADIKENKITATEDIKFDYEDIKGQSENASYFVDKNIVELSGNASASRGEDHLTGKIIEIQINEKKVITKGRTSIIISPERYQ